MLVRRSALVALAEQGGCLRGATVVLFCSKTSVARVNSLAADPDARGQGIALALLQHAKQRAQAAGSAVLRLKTRTDNTVAQTLFAKRGFVRCGRRAVY